ncbi:hypothetical protein PP175_12190 [Aneurinibacillus sp. Ricciae_BoGa-3]|uniref:hypothetical protein n=1 Tax=Aneurinibacillus sp. Ricciae_BoGa-3 TaxID=3022697 RepID=UPI00233FE2E4|nr:hypothetical protein [Aneurinibacillus sp. Ricciae_BoGa-3]WCK56599.1 hypothetical protein PP175_12190 [Aneurinibacillus sp. Ricciae_BoGa-3]
MADEPNTQNEHRKKISLQEAIKQRLAEKKQSQGADISANKLKAGNQKVKSQQTKKANNQRRRTGV